MLTKVLAAGLVLGATAQAAPPSSPPYWADRVAEYMCENLGQGMGMYRAGFEATKSMVRDGWPASIMQVVEKGTYHPAVREAVFYRCPDYLF